MFKLFNRRPESAPVEPPPPRERHRPTLPPVDLTPERVAAALLLDASPNLVASALDIPETGGTVGRQIGEIRQYFRDDPAAGSMAVVTHLLSVGQIPGTMDVQRITEGVEASGRRIVNTDLVAAAITTLYEAGVADLPIEPGIEVPVWHRDRPVLPVTIDGKQTSPLAPERSEAIVNALQLVRWDQVAVRARLKRNKRAMSIIVEELFGEPLCDTRDLSGERRTILEDAILGEIGEKGGEVEDVALRIRRTQRETRHAEIVKREAPRRALRSAAAFLSRSFKGQR